jgi:hypothetical protein
VKDGEVDPGAMNSARESSFSRKKKKTGHLRIFHSRSSKYWIPILQLLVVKQRAESNSTLRIFL